MILSNTEIHRALDEGRISIDPEPAPRFPVAGERCPYQTSAVDLRLGDVISYFHADRPVTYRLGRTGFADLYREHFQTRTISANAPFELPSGQFVLGQTLEHVRLPLIPGQTALAGRVEGRSSLARSGLLVHFTAPTVHAGFQGTITLELINLGPFTIELTPGVRICQLILESVEGPPFRNDSQFHGQQRPGGL